MKIYASILGFLRFRAAISKIPEMIAVLEYNDELTFCFGNDAFNEMFGEENLPLYLNIMPLMMKNIMQC